MFIKRTKKANRKPVANEEQEQMTVVDYLVAKRIAHYHVPNEQKLSFLARQNSALASIVFGVVNKLKRLGMAKGVPDLVIPVVNRHAGLYIEMKAKSGGKVSESQLGWINYLNMQGYKAVVCHGADEAIKEIDKYMIG
ncbi:MULTISPECIES: VRR-NUC domain-containing protein [Cysteiniphilum]|uniref:VRR-NUC domain-containing protein n=1 Tax=Cysteiniphilum TaxID=2056696 RepID=UPI00177EA6E6|nr:MULTISPECIES: VRR-NUC domain-containing protein [Cysteiniphilum]